MPLSLNAGVAIPDVPIVTGTGAVVVRYMVTNDARDGVTGTGSEGIAKP